MSILAGVAGGAIGKVLSMRWGAAALLGTTGLLSLGLGLAWAGRTFHGIFTGS